MKAQLVLVTLNEEQTKKAKEANGARKQITHALLCGPSGQIFGTEKQCRKYYSAWSAIFPNIFSEALESSHHEINDYSSTFDLVNILIAKHDDKQSNQNSQATSASRNKPTRKGFFSKLFNRN